jgi:hypothetical protein
VQLISEKLLVAASSTRLSPWLQGLALPLAMPGRSALLAPVDAAHAGIDD